LITMFEKGNMIQLLQVIYCVAKLGIILVNVKQH